LSPWEKSPVRICSHAQHTAHMAAAAHSEPETQQRTANACPRGPRRKQVEAVSQCGRLQGTQVHTTKQLPAALPGSSPLYCLLISSVNIPFP
jgi:hypothetical protein